MKFTPEAIAATQRRAQEPIRRQTFFGVEVSPANDGLPENLLDLPPEEQARAVSAVMASECDRLFARQSPAPIPTPVADEPETKTRQKGSEGPSRARLVAFTVPLRTVPGLNARENHWVRAKRVKQERAAISRGLRKALGCDRWACSGVVSLPAVVPLTRVSPRGCDSDNLAGALKAVRDSVAAFLGVDDGADWVEWRYRQERGDWGVRVEIAPRGAATNQRNLQGCSREGA